MMPSSTAAATSARRYYPSSATADRQYSVVVDGSVQSSRWLAVDAPPSHTDLTGERVRWDDVRASAILGSTRGWSEVEVDVVDDE